ncbi:MAG: hypothetical protein GXN98_01085 [Euryarchaeota archaeon]|nr:hypothetical protein [Euryarchaeota archaeon]
MRYDRRYRGVQGGGEALLRNPYIALPFVVANFAVSALLYSISELGIKPEAEAGMIGVSLLVFGLSIALSGIAQGVGVRMGVEIVERGRSSLATGMKVLERQAAQLVLASAAVSVLVLLGLMLVVIPGIIAGFLLMFTITALVIEELPAFRALKRSYDVVLENTGDALLYGLILVVLNLLAGITSRLFQGVDVLYLLVPPLVDALVMGVVTIAGVLFFLEAKRSAQASAEG